MKKGYILRWFKKAESDLKVAEHMLEVEEPPTDAICFHCQQAVEKYFKAYLTSKNIRVKKTHDLEALLNLCIEQDKEFENLNKGKISSLSFFAVDVRYPDEFYMPSINEAKEYVELTKKVKLFVMKRLNIRESDIRESKNGA
ncbi:MAG: HEPN domain protein [Methanosarcinales archeaon 56_1174]|uniref:HEPN domain-containing protein n=1 Tax=Methermicoccus shengliensis TaxID=660064 RepID=UPI0005B27C61|nr:HEPN domain-containing protein [Methermicoccus shengliensis]KUK30281.1 MAG: HEPN domain protein [Methanosarcinales archeaon 56_1174]